MEAQRIKNYISERLEELTRLPEKPSEDWRAKAITPAARSRADQLSEELDWPRVPEPAVFPTSSGGVILEFHANHRELALEITEEGELEFLTTEDGRPINEGTVHHPDAIRRLVNWLNQA